MSRYCILLLAALCALAPLTVHPAPAEAADQATAVSKISGRVVQLGLNKSMVIDVGEDVRDVLVSSPAIADAVLKTNRRVYLFGVAVGEANIFLFGENNRQIAQFELIVARDTVGLEATMASVLPGSQIRVQTIGESIVLSGTVTSPEAAAKAADIAARAVGDPNRVVNTIRIAGSDQVNLRVVVAEVQRSAARQLGVNFTAQVGDNVIFRTIVNNSFGVAGSPLSGSGFSLSRGNNRQILFRALEENGVLRTLAEPNVTAVSGENASLLVGGQVPALSEQDDNGRATYTLKDVGVGLSFTPVVLSPGLISLKIKTEISEIDTANSFTTGTASGTSITVPAFKTRRAETTVELPSGGSIAIGGLIKDDIRVALNGIPGLMNLPVLGALFKSRDYLRDQTELVIFVTPYVVDPVKTSALVRPDQNFDVATDAQGFFLNQINRVYRPAGRPPAGGAYRGQFGFAYE